VQLSNNYQEQLLAKIDGNTMIIVWFFILLQSVSVCAASLELRVQDAYGHRVHEIGVGQPFTVLVSIKDTDGKDLQPIIRTKPTITLQRAGQNMTVSNRNAVAIQYIYRSRIDTPGTYTIGPATIVYQGNTVTSNTITLHVTDQPSATNNTSDAKQDVFFELSTQVKTAVVGQKIPISLAFYYRDKSVRVINVLQPSSPQFTLKGDPAGIFGTQELRGVTYNVMRWNWYIVPQNTGRIVIPAHCVDYEVEKKSGGRLGALSFFFDSGYETKRAYSNAVTVNVEALPAHRGPILAVGTFESAKLAIEPSVAQEGHAMVLSLEMTGDTEWDIIKSPEIVGLPEGLRCYESKHYMRRESSALNPGIKCFEYVIQGLKPGKWRIPSQEFVVFDVESSKYKTLATGTVMVTITKNNAIPSGNNNDLQKESNGNQTPERHILPDTVLALNQEGPWSSVPAYPPLPTWLFILLMLLPVWCGVAWYGYGIWRSYNASRMTAYRSRRAFVTARLAIEQAQRNHDTRSLYYIFIQLFADYYAVDQGHISATFIDQKLSARGVSEHLRTQWREFFMHLASYVFSKQTHTASPQVFLSAITWVDLWEKLL